MGWLGRMIDKAVSDAIQDQVPKLLDERLPAIIDHIAADRFASVPDGALTEAGFSLAMSLALREYWPDVDRHTAAKWLWDYIDVPFGTDGYCWTPRAAGEIARAYVEEFGEEK